MSCKYHCSAAQNRFLNVGINGVEILIFSSILVPIMIDTTKTLEFHSWQSSTLYLKINTICLAFPQSFVSPLKWPHQSKTPPFGLWWQTGLLCRRWWSIINYNSLKYLFSLTLSGEWCHQSPHKNQPSWITANGLRLRDTTFP